MPGRRLPTLEELTADDDDVVQMLLEWQSVFPVSDILTEDDKKRILNYYDNAQDELDEY